MMSPSGTVEPAARTRENETQPNWPMLPIHHISVRAANSNNSPTKDELRFYCKVLVRAIDSVLKFRYTDFDAHTTTTCCHGISLYAREILLAVQKINLREISDQILVQLLSGDWSKKLYIPEPLVELCRLFICSFVKAEDPVKKIRTTTYERKLQEISGVSATFCQRLVYGLQKYLSNLIADKYALYARLISEDRKINGVLVEIWARYVCESIIRVDARGVKYAPCIYSMQVSLAYLIFSGAKLLVVNDFFNEAGEAVDRYICILQGEVSGDFTEVPLDEVLQSSESVYSEPVVVFGGCSKLINNDIHAAIVELKKWMNCFPTLVLACDTHYPQFPCLPQNIGLDSQPIKPEEIELRCCIENASKISGTSYSDSSLFCLAHIYPCSLKQVISSLKNIEDCLPLSFVPSDLKLSETVLS